VGVFYRLRTPNAILDTPALGLTDISIKNAKPKDRPYKLADGEGMYLLINPDGSRYWRLKYRFEGKEKVLALGVYGSDSGKVPLKLARQKRDEARKLLSDGVDPAAERKTRKRAAKIEEENSFESVAGEYIAKRANRWAPGYADHVRRRLELNILPELGRRAIAKIEPMEILDALRKVEKRGAYDQAHRVLQICSQVFRYGVATGKCRRDITADLKGALTPHKPGKMPAVKPNEVPKLLTAIDAHKGEEQTRIGLWLLALTFVRTAELIPAKWPEFDFANALWTVPAVRMKKKREHLVPLAPQTLALLERLRALNGCSEFLFSARTSAGYISNNTLLTALYRAGYRGKMSGHGFRAVFRTTMTELRSLGKHSFSKEAVSLQMAHKQRDKLAEAYDRAELLPERTSMMAWWADYLASARAGKETRDVH